VDFQAHEQSLWVRYFLSKRWVFNPVRSLPGLEICCWRGGFSCPWEYSLGESFAWNCSLVRWALVAGLKEFLSGLLLVTMEGKWGSWRTVKQRRGTLPLVWRVWGMRDYKLVVAMTTLDWAIMWRIRPYPVIRKPFFPGGFKPQLEGDLLLKIHEQHSLLLRGMSDLCTQLVTFHKI